MPGRVRVEPRLESGTRTIRADWKRTLVFSTAGRPEGAYVLRLDSEAGHQRYIPLIVRSTHDLGLEPVEPRGPRSTILLACARRRPGARCR
ncbi:N,N-dimethylformamidase beta subunit family domain-containing protein [Streptomyces sp. NPDC102270]|uniref:N,N-dimethylformamidase beta subunit family domain-containing protein n=1 Tax=Streptomyces sp. NPDC102270 TaxID=3366150 RepID=UPI0038205EE6